IKLEKDLASFGERHIAENPVAVLASHPAVSYRYGMGRKNYLNEVRQLMLGARTEVLRIAPPNGLRRVYISGSLNEMKAAAAMGVEIRLITEVNESNLRYAKMLSKIIHVRHLKGVGFRL